MNKQIVELPGNSPLEYSDAFLHNLLDMDSCSVVGLGEAAHGAKEFFELKHRLFKYFVEHHDFKVLAYEFSFRTSLKVNDYVLHGKGDLDSLFAGELWIQDNFEVQDLVQWMRSYNSDRKLEDKIHFVGIDNQLDAFYPERTIERINYYYPAIAQQNPDLIEEILNLKPIKYEGISRKEFEKRKRLFEKLLISTKSYLQAEADLINSLNAKLTIHLVECLIRSNQWLFNIFTGGENNRDSDLAQNVLWAKEIYNSKMAIWAHTSHVQNNPTYGENGEPSMGYHLRESLKEKYLIISTAFTYGKFKAVMEGPDGKDTPPLDCEISEDPPAGSVNELFRRAKYENFFLNVSEIHSGTQLHSYLDTVRPALGIGDWFEGSALFHYSGSDRTANLLDATDLVFYFSSTQPLSIHRRFDQ